MLLQNKNIIVTGSNRGIGIKTVEVLAENGANIWACARKYSKEFEDNLTSISKKHSVWIKPIYFDLSDSEQIKEGVKKIRSDKLKIDALANIAGINSKYTKFYLIPIEQYKKTLQNNLFGQLEFTQHISRLMMKEKSGSIVNLSSIAASDGILASCDYVASKAAIKGTTIQQARDLGDYNIRVNSVAPGITLTDMISADDKEILNNSISSIMLKRFADAKEIANVILFLVSDLSSYITGQEIRVDGGTSPFCNVNKN